MKLFFSIFASFVLIIYTGLSEKITILHVNDTHSNLSEGGNRDANLKGSIGGIARAATIIKDVHSKSQNILTLHAGDALIGDAMFYFTFGALEFQLMNALGFDAMTLGNHEFDISSPYLKSILKSSIAQGGFQLLSANIKQDKTTPDGDTIRSMVKNYIVKDFNGKKIGIFGMTTPKTNYLSSCKPDIVFVEDPNTLGMIVAANVQALKTTEKCDIVIMLSHLGYNIDATFASMIPGIDIIIGGHDHKKFDKAEKIQGTNTYYVEAGEFYHFIGKMDIDITDKGFTIDKYELIPLDSKVTEDPDIKATIDSYIAQIDQTAQQLLGIKIYTQAIGVVDQNLTEVSDLTNNPKRGDTEVGNLVSSAFKLVYQTDIGITVGGCTSQPLYAGYITPADIFRMIGYGVSADGAPGYNMVTFKLSGLNLYKGLEFGASEAEKDDEQLVQVAGMKYHLNIENEPGKRITDVLIDGKPLDPQKMYSIATNYLVYRILRDFVQLPSENDSVYAGSSEFQTILVYLLANYSAKPIQAKDFNETIRITDIKDEIIKQNRQGSYVFPNPASNKLLLTFNNESYGFYSLSVFSPEGQKVINQPLGIIQEGLFMKDLDTSSLSQGKYYYTITDGINNYTGSFIINR